MLKKNRAASVIGLAAVASLTLAACSEEGGEGASNVEGLADVTGELQGEGATSQQRAMDLFATKFEETGSTPVSYTHLTLPTTLHECRSRWSPYH